MPSSPATCAARYGTGEQAFEAVRGVDLTVETGSIHALLGINGAGKTSTLETIEGLASPSAGSVSVLDLDPVADRAEVRRPPPASCCSTAASSPTSPCARRCRCGPPP